MNTLRALALVGALGSGCSDGGVPFADTGPQVLMDLERAPDALVAPYPATDLTTNVVGRWANPTGDPYLAQLTELAGEEGFGRAGPILIPLSTAPSVAELPDASRSLNDDAAVFLLDVGARQRVPVDVRWIPPGGRRGPKGMLSLVPATGFVLLANRLYAAVVRRSLHAADGRSFVAAPLVTRLAAQVRANQGTLPSRTWTGAGEAPAAWLREIAVLQTATRIAGAGVSLDEVAGFTGVLVREARPTSRALEAQLPYALQAVPRQAPVFARTDIAESHCVYQATLRLPMYQGGTATGGAWSVDAAGMPRLTRLEEARVTLSIPRRRAPREGHPWALFVGAGSRGDRPLVDRGVAATLAMEGWAGLSWEAPRRGARPGSAEAGLSLELDETNPAAWRDGIRQIALEGTLVSALAVPPFLFTGTPMRVDVSDCPGAGAFDGGSSVELSRGRYVIQGHDDGAIAALMMPRAAIAPLGLVLSGVGGGPRHQWFVGEPPAAAARFAARTGHDAVYPLREDDVALGLLQGAVALADPVLNAATVPPTLHVLMVQSVGDTVTPPRASHAVAHVLRAPLVGDALDGDGPDSFARGSTLLARVRSLNPFDPWAPSGVRGVVQVASTAGADAHEAVFENPAAITAQRCFLRALAASTPAVARACPTLSP